MEWIGLLVGAIGGLVALVAAFMGYRSVRNYEANFQAEAARIEAFYNETGATGSAQLALLGFERASPEAAFLALNADSKARTSIMQRYQKEGLQQSRWMFVASLVFAALGFTLILLACAYSVFGSPTVKDPEVLIPLVSGVIVDAAAGLFFAQSNRSRKLMTEFFDRLRTDDRLQEGMLLAKAIRNEDLRNRIQAALALRLADGGLDTAAVIGVLDGGASKDVKATGA